MGQLVKHDIGLLYGAVRGSQKMHENVFFRSVFDAGGYVAGGMVRKLFRDGTVDGLHDFFERSDIDVFVPDCASYFAVKQAFRDILHVPDGSWQRTPAHNAWTARVSLHGLFGRAVTVQLIDCRLDPVEQMLGSFDFTNCRFAIDAAHVWVDNEARDLESGRTLQVHSVTDLLGSRVLKYFSKGEYDVLEEQSRRELLDWIQHHEDRSWVTEPGKRSLRLGSRVVVSLAQKGLLNDKTLVNYLNRFKKKVKVASFDAYGGLVSSSMQVPPVKPSMMVGGIVGGIISQHVDNRVYAEVDEIELVLNEPRTRDVTAGDMVEVVPGAVGQELTSSTVIVLAPFGLDHFRVACPVTNRAFVMPRYAFRKVVSRYCHAEG